MHTQTDLDVEEGDRFRPIALVNGGTFKPGMDRANRLAFQIAAMAALIVGGVWKKHALAHG